MTKEIKRTIEIPAGFEVEVRNGEVLIKNKGKQSVKKIPFSNKLEVKNLNNVVEINCKKPTRRENALAGTMEAHIRNTIRGLGEDYVYKMEICNVHFPMTVKIDGRRLVVKNFLGEKLDRVAKLLEGVEISLKGNIIELKSADKDSVGQTAANIETATKVGNRDRRVFQDGIYITEKGGKVI